MGKAFLPKSGTRQEYPHAPCVYNTGSLTWGNKTRKANKSNANKKGKIRVFTCVQK